MHSRAHLLIEKQFHALSASSPWGISVSLRTENNLFEWVARIRALNDSIWEGGVFQLYIKFNEHYNIRPPAIHFHTIPFHPNVDMVTGQPCVDFLDNWTLWNQNYSMTFVLLSLQMLLSSPVLENAVNQEAVGLLREAPETYRQVVSDCVAASQKLDAEFTAHGNQKSPLRTGVEIRSLELSTDRVKELTDTSIVVKVQAKIAKLSFDNYYRTWSKIATSQNINCMSQTECDRYRLMNREQDIAKQAISGKVLYLDEHAGNKFATVKAPSVQEEKLARIQHMRRIYLQPSNTPRTKTGKESARDVGAPKEKVESWEEEVNELVDWSEKLDDGII